MVFLNEQVRLTRHAHPAHPSSFNKPSFSPGKQVSHHPPISTFWLETFNGTGTGKQKVQACGVDQISAKFTGTSVRCYPGSQSRGMFVKFPERGDEEYEVGLSS